MVYEYLNERFVDKKKKRRNLKFRMIWILNEMMNYRSVRCLAVNQYSSISCRLCKPKWKAFIYQDVFVINFIMYNKISFMRLHGFSRYWFDILNHFKRKISLLNKVVSKLSNYERIMRQHSMVIKSLLVISKQEDSPVVNIQCI